ncbi:hypothetical protein PybrP1_012410, partial [[Pythium] brassicae (nom. inval.)]
SKDKFLEAQAREEQARTRGPAGSPPGWPLRGAGRTGKQAAPASGSEREREKGVYTLTAVTKESAGRAHGFNVTTRERKPLHLAAESELERVVWLHLIAAALEQQENLPKARKALAAGNAAVVAPATAVARGGVLRTLLGTPASVNLVLFYDAWGLIQGRKGNFADLVPSLHPNLAITSNYPPSVPIAGEYHGGAGFIAFFAKLHSAIDISHYTVQHIARSGDLAVVTGRETIRNVASGRKFRHRWKHELRFEADGRVSHINIIADKTAAAVAFGVQSDGPSLELPHEQEESASTCPPGAIRVVCISGEGIKKKKPIPSSASIKVTIGLNNFPHVTAKSASGGSGGGCAAGSTSGGRASMSRVGSWKSYSTRPSKNGSGVNPFWAETLSIQFSGAVPGTSSCLFVDVWSVSVMGDELIGCTKVNLANYLGTSAGTEEDVASLAVPRWYELRKPDEFLSTSGNGSPNKKKMASTGAAPPASIGGGSSTERAGHDSCGRLQLSISFQPYTDDDDGSFSDGAEPTPRHRKSFDRLQALHEETGEKERHTVERRLSATFCSENDSGGESGSVDDSRESSSENADRRHRRSSAGNGGGVAGTTGSLDEMYSFTVASTKFRVYTRYQLIRAIGHGAYGVVIAASDQITGNSVAIKNVPKTFDDLVDAKRIVREIRLMRHLYHPNIVSVIDVMRPPSLAEFEDTYIVTDLMETDLHRVINSQEVLSSDHIAYLVGSPAKEDMAFITNVKAKKWMARQAHHEAKPLATVCPSAPADALDLMVRLLEFDPRKRISVDDAIAHPFVAQYRQPEVEGTAAAAFDFSFEKENRHRLDKDTLRRLIFEDVCHFHPDAREELDRYMFDQERLQAVEDQAARLPGPHVPSFQSQRAGIA